MIVVNLHQTKQWLKTSPHPLARMLFKQIKAVHQWEVPAPRALLSPLYHAYCSLRDIVNGLIRLLWWTPLFKGRLHRVGDRLYLYGGLPYVSGPVQISFGNDCRVSGHTTVSGRTCATKPPRLIVGDNVDIGWMTTIAVGTQVSIGNNVRIAGRTILAGYPGHPMDAKDRAAGLPDTDEQAADIILEDDVWLATGVSVMAGVRIGQGTVVAAGSVVSRDLPPRVLAGGIPARIIRSLDKARDDEHGA